MLLDAVSDALYEYEGIDKGISRRTIQGDIQMMRSNKLGYNAPIIIKDKKYYTYEDPEYSITNKPLSEQDLHRINEAVEMLRQFKGFSHFSRLNEVVQKLEDHVYAAAHQTPMVIDFEKNEQLKGLEHLETIYHAITQQRVIMLTYQSFTAKQPSTFAFHPWWLKEFKNRWFCIGIKEKNAPVLNLALDRIISIEFASSGVYLENQTYHLQDFYRDVIGVTVSPRQRRQKVRIFVDYFKAPYVETKPLHHSQEVVERLKGGIIIQITVQLNYELEKEILGFGEGMKVLAPEKLAKIIKSRMEKAVMNYTIGILES
jgi:predicted DNA-binding transcriptional regulator YafY